MPGCPLFRKHIHSKVMAIAAPCRTDGGFPFPLMLGSRVAPRALEGDFSFDLPIVGYSLKVFSSIDQARVFWNTIQPEDNRFLGENYLRVVEKCPPEGVVPYYLVFFKDERPAGIAYVQLIDFRAERSLQQQPLSSGAWPRFARELRKWLLCLLRFRVLHLGNLLLTGPRGFSFSSQVSEEEGHSLLSAALPPLRKYLQRRYRNPIQAYVVKDISPEENTPKAWQQNGYWELCFLPNMVFPILPEWKTFDDYLGSLHSKYRVRARRAFRLLDGVESRELDAAEIFRQENDLYGLYREVAASVDFNMANIHPGYFKALKTELGDAFHLVGYYLHGKLVGFYTTMENGKELEAHFIGFDQSINRDNQLYLNMLFDMIRMGIELRSEYISFARTAMEIKSSVGAVAEQFKCYIRHRSPLVNMFVGPLVRWLQPEEEWERRHPFK